jgi:hypothetical protein
MKPAMEIPQPVLLHMGVDLGSGNIRVTEHLLDDPQVSSVIEQVGGKRMPQKVRINILVQPGPFRDLFHDHPDPTRS